MNPEYPTDLKKGDEVKYSNPQKGEEDFRFTLLDDPQEEIAHAKRNGVNPWVDIQLIGGNYAFPPIENVPLSEITKA